MNKSDEAVKRLMETFNCAQAILSTYGPELGLDREHSLKVAAAFGGGIAGMGETCGVVSGALMAIGLAYGKTRADDRGAGEATQKAAHTFLERFKQRNFTLLCRELLGCDVATPEGRKFMKEHNLKENLCAVMVRDAAEILEELLFPADESASEWREFPSV